MEKEIQKAGDNSNQTQNNYYITNNINGITEDRAIQICKDFLAQSKEFTVEANKTVCDRVNKYINMLIPKISEIEGALDNFKDPAFQQLIKKSQISAALTDSQSNYELLTTLITVRIEKEKTCLEKVAINRAVEVINDISDDALIALTLVFCIENILPTIGNISKGLQIIDETFSRLCYGKLPEGNDWIDNLDIIDAIRWSRSFKLIPLEEFYIKSFSSYCVIGIKKDSENFEKAKLILEKVGLENVLIDNELNENYVRLAFVKKTDVDKLYEIFQYKLESEWSDFPNGFTKEQKDALNEVYSMYIADESLLCEFKQKFVNKLLSYSNIRKVAKWWNKIELSFCITSVGRVIAYANSKRCDKTMPNYFK